MSRTMLADARDGRVAAGRADESVAEATERAPTFVSIQALRGLAATLVVLFHAFTALAGDPELQERLFRALEPLECGVDVFFVVSGFILAAATDGPRPPAAATFLLHRAQRIFPLYWLACLIYLPSAVLSTGFGRGADDAGAVLSSFLLLPLPLERALLAQSWTLTHEWQFYGFVALCLALGIRHRLAAVLAGLAVVGLVQEATGTQLASDSFVSGYMAEFLAGLLIYQGRNRLAAILPPRRALACLAVAVLLLAVEAATGAKASAPMPRLVSSGVPALLIVVGAVALEAELVRRRTSAPARFVRLLGDTSYSIYLFHLCALGGIGTLLTAYGPTDPWLQLVAAAAAVVVAVGFGVAIGVCVELPLLDRIRRRRHHDGAPRRLTSAPAE